MEETNEITLQEIFSILWSKLFLIILGPLLGGVVAFSITYWGIEPEYTSRISMFVNNTQNRENLNANINDINASQKLVATYIELLKSDKFLHEVSEVAELEYTPNQLRDAITANAINGTEIFEIKVTMKDKEVAAHIANTIGKIAPEEIIRVVKAGSVALIDEAVVVEMPSSPNITLNTLIGMMLGGVLAVLGVLVAAMLDNRIKSDEDIKKYFELPILGVIPDLEDAQTRIK